MNLFENIPEKKDQEKISDKLEMSEHYALFRGFLEPKHLEEIRKQGWELIAGISRQNIWGYYFKKIKE